MKKRSKAGGKPIKGRRRKTPEPKRRNAPKAVPGLSSSTAEEGEAIGLTRELNEARKHQAATSEVLKVISSSHGDLQQVFATMLEKAVRICDAKFGNIYRWDGNALHLMASHNIRATRSPNLPGSQTPTGRMIATKTFVHVPDLAAELGYAARDPWIVDGVELAGVRTLLIVPMLKQNELIGAFIIYRQEIRPFTDKQIEILKNFATQAVIAIENARLLNELHQRTNDLTEALEQQTATSEVLQVISSSPGELEPVFAAMLASATRICEAEFGNLFLREGETFRAVAWHGEPTYVDDWRGEALIIKTDVADIPLARLAATKQRVHVADLRQEAAYKAGFVPLVTLVDKGGARTLLIVPMLKEHTLVGAITIYRQEVRPFNAKQIALVENFAAQAVIAIENARLLNELRQSLEQQTATADVLQVISRSPGDLEPVFATMLEQAVRICEASFGSMLLREGDMFRRVAIHDAPPEFVDFHKSRPTLRLSDAFALDQILRTKQVVQIGDAQAEEPDTPIAKYGGARTLLTVPLLKENEVIGALGVYRQEVRLFSDKQIALVENFAAQAVIAIENARLLNELRQRTADLTERTADLTEALEQQTATSEVLQVISSSPGNLEPVFATMLENAARICDASFGNIYSRYGDEFRLAAAHKTPPAFAEYRERLPIVRTSGAGLFVTTKTVTHINDLLAEDAYINREPAFVAAFELGAVRTYLSVPMVKENELIGALILSRQEVRPFTEEQIALVTNFAAQAVIAIENARLLNELRQRTKDLTEALEQQTATSEVLQVISSSSGLLEEVFASMLEKAVRICDAAFGNIYRWDGTLLHLVANHNTPPAWVEYRKKEPYRADNPFAIARMINSKAPVHVTDLSDEYYTKGVQLGEIKTFLAVPMLNGDDLIGAFIVSRKEVRPFTDKQIGLVHNFAAQAVIAIENARLLKELRDRTTEVERLNKQLEHRVTDQVDEIERMSRLRRFLPPQVADLIVASGSEKQLESHRREITALFCDLRGFTGFSESADPEDVMALLRDYHAAIGEIVIKYGGTLERYAGDGVMVVFNDPVPVENPALQAVLMALELRDGLGVLTATWSRLGHEIGFGIGIAHGFATLGTIGFEGRFDYAAIGTVSNVASRLCDEAKPGQILISPRVLMKVESAVTVEPVGEFELKGIRRPLAAYNVVAALASKI